MKMVSGAEDKIQKGGTSVFKSRRERGDEEY